LKSKVPQWFRALNNEIKSMKNQIHTSARFTDSTTVPMEIPVATTDGRRPVRRGNFWPGESFGACTRKWDLTGVFIDNAFVLPALIGGNGSRMH
jgi:hypothetical protein